MTKHSLSSLKARVLSCSLLVCATCLSGNSLFGQDKLQSGETWNPASSDQWVARDNLGRELPGFNDVGPTRPDKYIACFYFLWNGRHGDAGPFDISKILKEHPEAKNDPNAPWWGPMHIHHHWGEPVFGYYVGEDESVLRKHAQMLGDAGVDVICFDVTNQITYPESYLPLFKVFSEMQKAGNRVPKVAFLCPFGAPNKVVRELWRDVYSKGVGSDVWFYWKGKPLILADPDLLPLAGALTCSHCNPVEVGAQDVLAQKFSTEDAFSSISVVSPTWNETGSFASLRLLDEKGKTVAEQIDLPVSDNQAYVLNMDSPAPAGIYTLELRRGKGNRVGWWCRPAKGTGEDYSAAAAEAHSVKGVKWLEAAKNGQKQDLVFMMTCGKIDKERQNILDFFTFRPSQASYFTGPTKPNQWSWLEVYPQHEFHNDKGELEEVGVGVAQNAVEGKLGVLSNPKAHGRSFHDGAEPAPEDCDYTGRNFQEQWERALKLDPEIIFVTGWNEWTAMRFGKETHFNGMTEVSFVDQYNEEFSRDCEPMRGGHSDAYYYQLISNIRRFKGVSKPEAVRRVDVVVDGKTDDWTDASPVFRDTVSDPVDRDCRGAGKGMRYVNKTGRNDIVEARVSYDEDNIYFLVKTNEKLQGDPSSENWITLMIDSDDNPDTGVKGADFLVLPDAASKSMKLVKTAMKDGAETVDADYRPTDVSCRIFDKGLEIAVPKKELGISDKLVIRFKWTDGIDVFGDWSNFTTDGDAAPNDRYFYRYDAR